MQRRRRRLRLASEIAVVLRRGRSLSTPWVRIYWRPGQHTESRFAAIVGKKVSQLAVRRHRYQRWLRQVAQEGAAVHFPIPSDMVWVATPRMADCHSLAELREHVMQYYQR